MVVLVVGREGARFSEENFASFKSLTVPRPLQIGCGTGAGGNLITQLLPGATYTAVDMQKAAIQTCNEVSGVVLHVTFYCMVLSRAHAPRCSLPVQLAPLCNSAWLFSPARKRTRRRDETRRTSPTAS